MDYFSALNIFHAVADTGSFSAAAKQLGVAVSSVTRQIDSLEESLGVPLFSRSTRQFRSPTQACFICNTPARFWTT